MLNNLLQSYEKEKSLKVLVSYIKPSFLFKTNILTPIHLGRAISSNEWLIKNCIGDNDFDGNISHTNRRVGFLTGTYWAWKNYEKLGNPDYFGSFGYRKLFDPICLENLEDYDLILPQKRDLGLFTNKKMYENAHANKMYEILKDEEYLNLNYGYYHEIYIMKKELFFGFCEWIFPILFKLLETPEFKVNPEKLSMYNAIYTEDKRDIGFLMELFTGAYLYRLTKKYKYKEVPIIMTEEDKIRVNYRENLLKLIRGNIKNDT